MDNKKSEMNFPKFFSKLFKPETLYEYFGLGLIGLCINYLNQSLSWSFESFESAIVKFTIFSLAFLFILFLFARGLFNKIKSLPPFKFKRKKWLITLGEVNIKYLIRYIFYISLFVLFSTLLLRASFDFFNRLNLKAMVDTRSEKEYPQRVLNSNQDKGGKWAVINLMKLDNLDDESLAFANNFQNDIEMEVRKMKLPIKPLEISPKDLNLDSLKKEYEGVYLIKGTYHQNSADVYVESYLDNSFLSSLFSKLDEQTAHKMDSVLKLTNIEKYKTLDYPPITHDSDDMIVDSYNLKLGVPNEIKYLIYSTIGDYIVKDIAKKTNNNSKELIVSKAKFGVDLLQLAKFRIPYELNYWGFSPKVRSNINLEKLYRNQSSLYSYLANNELDEYIDNKSDKTHLNTAREYLKESVKLLNEVSTEFNSSNVDVFYGTVQSQIIIVEHKMLKTQLKVHEIVEKSNLLSSEVKTFKQKSISIGNDGRKFRLGSLPRVEDVNRWIEESNNMIRSSEELLVDFIEIGKIWDEFLNKVKETEYHNIFKIPLENVRSTIAINTNEASLKLEKLLERQKEINEGFYQIKSKLEKRK